ncbi:hypothetical protein B9Z55_005132 [Caenorhabditis nigoni]|uniref:Uncharacterized protein n=1 Tax=Caenorhabditis nigoni TaxID=1611254 RepID=A0A2G5UZI0_9PELO|nr:hypothetical protein B9Z55_005132 [Caenorhabditis nigoni]
MAPGTAELEIDETLHLLRMLMQREFIHYLETLPGTKELFIDKCLLRPLDMIATSSDMKRHGVKRIMHFDLKKSPQVWNLEIDQRVFFLRPNVDNARKIVEYAEEANDNRSICVIWCNRQLEECDLVFESSGVIGNITQLSLNMCLLPLESDLFSLQHVESAQPDLFSVANMFVALQNLYGVIPTVYGLGAEPKQLWNLVHTLCSSNELRARPDQPISHLFLFDRQLDPIPVLLTGASYEGLLHEFFNIDCGKLAFPVDMRKQVPAGPLDFDWLEINPEEDEEAHLQNRGDVVKLDNCEDIFASIRNKHVTAALEFLHAKAKSIQKSIEKSAMIDDVADYRNFVEKDLRALKKDHKHCELHINACEMMMNKVKMEDYRTMFKLEHEMLLGTVTQEEYFDFVFERVPMRSCRDIVLSMMSLASLKLDGVPDDTYNEFVEMYLQKYGYEHMFELQNLRCSRVIYARRHTTQDRTISERAKIWDTLARKFRIVKGNEPMDMSNPSDMSYVFGARISPLLCKIVEDTIDHGWNQSEYERILGKEKVLVEENTYIAADRRPDNRTRKAIMVFINGGITYWEVAALRLLAIQKNFRILICTTHIIKKRDYLGARAQDASSVFGL